MNSIYDADNLQSGYVPVVYGYYDRANMMESTPEVINHSHSLCEIMYVNEGTMSIETESNGYNQVGCSQFIWIDAGIRHWDLRFNKGLCSMMNIEFQYEEGEGLAPDLTGLLPTMELTQGNLIIGDYEFTTIAPSFSLNADGNLVDGAGNIVETLASGVIGILHLNDKNQLVDANGNLISAEHYDPLPVGYQYVLDENGNINILMMPTETAATTAPAEETEGTDWQKLALPIGAAAAILALGAVLAVVLKRRHTDPQKAAEKMKARRLRQRKRRAKAQDRASRKDQYNNKRF